MEIQIVPYQAQHRQAVRQFNQRIRQEGETLQFPESDVCVWLPNVMGRRLYQDYFVAVDSSGAVRGGYILKHQEYWINGKLVNIGDFRLPISEGPINPTYIPVATDLLFHALCQQRRLYGLGIGGMDLPISKFLKAGGWRFLTVPFLFKVVRPFRFFRKLRFLRSSIPRRLALDLIAFSGAGWLGVNLLQGLQDRRLAQRLGLRAIPVSAFGAWAQDLWEAQKHRYRMTAVRDLDSLRLLYPESDPRFIRLQVCDRGRILGWAVMLDTPWQDHKQFGAMRLGSLVDAFAAPEDAAKVVSAATRHMVACGVDLIVTNQSHREWIAGCKVAGFLRGPSNFFLATAPAYTKLLAQEAVGDDDLYINRGDGDGPIHL